eukprot:15485793-Alexandrium_andersonii.AAC.1
MAPTGAPPPAAEADAAASAPSAPGMLRGTLPSPNPPASGGGGPRGILQPNLLEVPLKGRRRDGRIRILSMREW